MKTNFEIAESLSQKWFKNKSPKNVMALLDAVCRGVDLGLSRNKHQKRKNETN